MKTSILLLVALACLTGCMASPAFYKTVEAQYPPIGDSYQHYVSSDATLSPADKQVLLNSDANMRLAITKEGARQQSVPWWPFGSPTAAVPTVTDPPASK